MNPYRHAYAQYLVTDPRTGCMRVTTRKKALRIARGQQKRQYKGTNTSKSYSRSY